jgi:hypothetical protein
MLDFVQMIDQLGLRVSDTNSVVKAFLDDDKNVAINGRAQNPAAFSLEVVAKIGTTTEKANSDWSLSNNHCGSSVG